MFMRMRFMYFSLYVFIPATAEQCLYAMWFHYPHIQRFCILCMDSIAIVLINPPIHLFSSFIYTEATRVFHLVAFIMCAVQIRSPLSCSPSYHSTTSVSFYIKHTQFSTSTRKKNTENVCKKKEAHRNALKTLRDRFILKHLNITSIS